MALFSSRKKRQALNNAPCPTCAAAMTAAQTHASLHSIGSDMMASEPRLVARVNLGMSDEENVYADVYEHDLQTFSITRESVPLLNALYMDAAWGCNLDGYASFEDRYKWILETHRYSARHIDKNELQRWDQLIFTLRYCE